METKKIVIRFFIFLGLSCLAYTLIVFLLMHIKINSIPLMYSISDVAVSKGGNTLKKFEDFDANAAYDIIVIGSSHAYRGYDPRIFKKEGLKLFNLGTSAQTPLNSYFIALNYIRPSGCKLVIMDIYDEALTSDGVESTADLMQNISSTATVVKMGLALKDPRMLNMLMLRFLNSHACPGYIDPAYVVNGYSETKDSIKNIQKEKYISTEKTNPVQLVYLEKILHYFYQTKTRVIVVTHPAPKEWGQSTHRENKEAVGRIVGKYKMEYLDYFEYPGFDSGTDYYDTHHLNQAGVEKFNAILIRDMRQKGLTLKRSHAYSR